MNTVILVPTDFSELARKGILYACELASALQADIKLLYVYPYPAIPAEVPSDFFHSSSQQLREAADTKIHALMEELSALYPDIQFHKLVDQGPVVANISQYAETEKASLIVMATAGAEGIKKWFVGSFAAGVVDTSEVPVLVIPDDFEFQHIPQKILFATDYAQGEPGPLEEVASLAALIDAEIIITHINLGNESLATEMFEWYKQKIEAAIPYHRKTFHLVNGDDLQQTLDSLVNLKQADLLVMSIRERTFWEAVKRKSETKEMAYHASVPLLTYHLANFKQ